MAGFWANRCTITTTSPGNSPIAVTPVVSVLKLSQVKRVASWPSDSVAGIIAVALRADTAATGACLHPSDKIKEVVADASNAAAKNLRRRAPLAGAGGCVGSRCSTVSAAADRPRAQS